MENKCIFCGSKKIKIMKSQFAPFIIERMFLSKKQETSLVCCENCNIIYSSYRPSDEEMARLYSGYRDENYQKQRQKYEPGYTEEFNNNLGHNPVIAESRKTFLTNLIKKYMNPKDIKRVLDYGGDNGQFIPDCFDTASKYVYEVSNVPTVDGVKNISEEDMLSGSKFDFVMCCHVLEHVSKPNDIINKLISCAELNGYIYIEVPYKPYKPDACDGSTIHEHISWFSKKTFLKMNRLFKNLKLIDIDVDSDKLYILIKKTSNASINKILNNFEWIIKPKLNQIWRHNIYRKIKTVYQLSK